MARPSTPRGLNPNSPRIEAARRLLLQRLADVRRFQDKLQGALEPEPVHDLRVATRRLRAALNVFRPLGTLRRLEGRVKHLQDSLGEVRDIHVQTEWLTQTAQEKKPKHRAGPEALCARLQSQLGSREEDLRTALEQWTRETAPAIEQEAERLEGSGRYGDEEDREVLLRRAKKMKQQMKQYANAPHPLLAHELRKTVKKLRYETELFRTAHPRDMDWLLEALKPLQEGLGHLHDLDVRMEVLEHFISDGSSSQRDAARKLLKEVSEKREEHASEVEHALKDWMARDRSWQIKRLLA